MNHVASIGIVLSDGRALTSFAVSTSDISDMRVDVDENDFPQDAVDLSERFRVQPIIPREMYISCAQVENGGRRP